MCLDLFDTKRMVMQGNTKTPQSTRKDAAESTSLLNTFEAAQVIQISKRGLQELVADRKIGFIKFGRNIRFDRSDIARFIEAHRCQPIGWKSATNREGNR